MAVVFKVVSVFTKKGTIRPKFNTQGVKIKISDFRAILVCYCSFKILKDKSVRRVVDFFLSS